MKLHQLRTFVAVAEHRSIRAAARALFVSQPAVTRTIRELEHDLDILLLRRSVEGVELTEAGAALQVRARLLLQDIRRTREELAFMKEGRGGQVSAAVTSTIGLTVLPDALESFMRRMPEARISLTEDAPPIALEKLRNGTLDFIVTNTLADDLPAEFVQHPLFVMQLMIVARAGHPARGARSLRELQGQRWVVPSLNRMPFHRLFTSHELEPPAAILGCESFGIAIHLASKMDLLMLASTPAYEPELRPRNLEPLKLKEGLPTVEVSVVTLRNARLTPATKCFVECLGAVPLPNGLSRSAAAEPGRASSI
ncbi:LysR substrate-binding domain-containing protein [Variovorax sp. Sphag1AA]|uniref:LysR substrate-binding domain-containing protein n=1 Tax=Variovorax sp. Sphag1AA TaxID=2587027 RepID=UPI00161AEA90|nr:LysR substrate-binding domain-containing protein [Variovorax sp. Sphag1AA]MBB3181273.1 DNA-binding transcriptional LysR family regulator [Variovorax sp. Sphag1AA]